MPGLRNALAHLRVAYVCLGMVPSGTRCGVNEIEDAASKLVAGTYQTVSTDRQCCAELYVPSTVFHAPLKCTSAL